MLTKTTGILLLLYQGEQRLTLKDSWTLISLVMVPGIYIHFTDTSIFLLYHKPPAIETQSSFPLSLYSSKNLLFIDKDGI